MTTALLLALLAQAPAASGPSEVGRADYHWTDRSRGREIGVHLWYPAPSGPQPAPVVLFSPGNGTPVSSYTAKLNDLASHGYLVVAPDYPGEMARCTPRAGAPYDEIVETGMRCLRERADIVAADIRFVIGEIETLNHTRGGSPDLEGRFDMTRLAAIGHSLGGFASARACQLDARIAACVNEDGGTADGVFLRFPGAAPAKQPFLYVEASVPAPTDQQLAANGSTRADWNARLARLTTVVHEQQMRSFGSGSMKVALRAPGMQHGSFGDAYLTASTDVARQRALHNLALCNDVTRAFLDKYLKHDARTLLDVPAASPEITVKRY